MVIYEYFCVFELNWAILIIIGFWPLVQTLILSNVDFYT